MTELLASFARVFRSKTLLLGAYSATVQRQNPDGTVDVMPEDGRLRGRGLAGVRLRGDTTEVEITQLPQGARCLLVFEEGDERRPSVSEWEAPGPSTATVSLGREGKPVARDGDFVNCDIVATQTLTGIVMIPSPEVSAAFSAGMGSVLTLPPLTPLTLIGVTCSPTATIAATCKSFTL